jgi:pSer/pThr/pTyr-binding forkhead associated (FHA) protein
MDGGDGIGLAISEGGRVHVVPAGGVLRIGRGAECEIWLDSQAVSRQHASIDVSHGALALHDLGSRNGVFVNGERITGDRKLKLGDRVLVGDRVLTVVSLDRSRLETAKAVPRSPSNVLSTTGSINMYAVELDTLRNTLSQGRTTAAKASGARLCEVLGRVVDVPGFDRSILDGVCSELMRLAEHTDDASWLDRLFDLHAHLRAPLEVKVMDGAVALIEALPPSGDTGRARFAAWSRGQPLTFSERAALKRLTEARSRRR